MELEEVEVLAAEEQHKPLIPAIVELIASAAAQGATLARRSSEEIASKIKSGLAVIALDEAGQVVGFAFASIWEGGRYASNSGLVVAPEYRQRGLARRIKEKVMELCQSQFPKAIQFSLTMSSSVMRMNSSLGFAPTGYAEITQDEKFWAGCSSCPHFETLKKMKRTACFCTALVLINKVDAPTKYVRGEVFKEESV